MKVIIQAGGKGTRLENFTRNKPKCLVSVKNKPLIFSAFEAFKGNQIYVIADYKKDILKKYIKVFGAQYNPIVVDAPGNGTASGISECLKDIPDDEPILIVWCDLFFEENFSLPSFLKSSEIDSNYVGLSSSFPCRWSFRNNEFVHESSNSEGVAGLFLFKNRKELSDVPDHGALVPWLKAKGLDFQAFYLEDVTEVGTIKSFEEIEGKRTGCRPFNQVIFNKDTVTKKGINEQGKTLGEIEIAWYKHTDKFDFGFLPKIFSFDPLVLEKIKGKNVWEYNCLTQSNKREILGNVLGALNQLHKAEGDREVDKGDCLSMYLDKTLSRLDKIKSLVPFADREFIKINGAYYKNPLFSVPLIRETVEEILPDKFCLIHGDPTFSNTLFDRVENKVYFIDPRGSFGNTFFYGDPDYDWAKVYYSLVGNYDQFNRKRFDLTIDAEGVEIFILPNNWADMKDYFFSSLPNVSRRKIEILHALIWLSLTTYAWDDFDSICGAFYKGVMESSCFM